MDMDKNDWSTGAAQTYEDMMALVNGEFYGGNSETKDEEDGSSEDWLHAPEWITKNMWHKVESHGKMD